MCVCVCVCVCVLVCQQDYTETTRSVSTKLRWRMGLTVMFGVVLDKVPGPGAFSWRVICFHIFTFFLW